MNRAQFVGTASAFALAGGTHPAWGATLSRSLWVWRTPLAEASSVAAFVQRNRFRSIFLSVTSGERSVLAEGDVASLDALRALKGDQRSVYAVAGDPSWVKHGHSEPPDSIRDLLGAHRQHGVFDGLALDVEPHTLPAWKDGSEQTELAGNYLQVLRVIRSAAAELNLPVLATVHPTYANYSPPAANGVTLLQAAGRAVDATDLMAYRNSENALERFGGAAMEQLEALAKPWWLGVSTHTGSPAGTSYATIPASRFFPEIDATAAEVAQRYGGAFAGISVEDYRNTLVLLGQA
ncbi:MAG TPA: hypothetical protein VFE16_06335 [Candidatus Cybelea sp.]|jgi:hypothetical protein|nr:hypothetical protein [Candidatus Cybelea sp.]